MDRSQLRQLTLAYARGDLDSADYHRQRTTLIEDITAGRQVIERSAPEIPSDPPVQFSSAETVSPHTKPHALRPAFVAVGTLVLVGVIWLVYPTQQKLIELRNPVIPDETSTTSEAVGPGQHLITEFLGVPDWSESSLQDLMLAWNALTEIERTEAAEAGKLSQLTRAIHTEVAIQQDIHERSSSNGSRQRLQILSALISTFALEHEFPDFVVPVMVSESSLDISETTSTTLEEAMPPEVATTEVVNESVTDATEVVSNASETPGGSALMSLETTNRAEVDPVHAWLDTGPVNGYAVQLFALSSATAAQRVIDKFPDLALKRLALPEQAAGHRVMLGVYDSYEDAVFAYRVLPDEITQVETPPVRPVQALRAQVAGAPVTSIENLEKNRRWLATQIANAYSLQLFAINDDQQVNDLVSSFPELNLKVHFSADTSARFRILYGSFETAELAAAAFATLPSRIRAISTRPIVTRFEDLQDSVLSAKR